MTMEDLIKAYMEIGTANISALMGPYTQVAATATHKFGIPYFIINDAGDIHFMPYNVISVLPRSDDRYDIAIHLLTRYNWTSVAVLYENNDGVRLIESLVRLPTIRVRAWRIGGTSSPSDDHLREVLLRVRQLEMMNIIVMSSEVVTNSVIETALRLSMMSKRYSWLLPTMTPNESTLKRYVDTQVNLTTMKLIQSHLPDNDFTISHYTKPEYAAIYDSLLALYHGVKIHYRNNHSCLWTGKENINPVLTKIEDSGATGELAFRSDSTRRGYIVSILTLVPQGLVQIGLWNSSDGEVSHRLYLNYTALNGYQQLTKSPFVNNRVTIKVVIILEPPWLSLRAEHEKGIGNNQFEGFCVDMLKALATKIGFSYTLYVVPDGQRGRRLPNGTWTGLMAEISNQRAHLAVGPLTITSSREDVVDFTKPFDTVSLTLLMKKTLSYDEDQTKVEDEYAIFYFLRPLSWIVWTLLVAIFITAGLLLYSVDRISANGGGLPPLSDHSLQRRPGLTDSFWYAFSSMILMAPSLSVPRSAAGRLLTGALWWFSLIIVASYAANLAAIMTWFRLQNVRVRHIGDLLRRHPGIKFVTVNNSDVGAFLKNSLLNVEDADFRYLWNSYAESSLSSSSSITGAASGKSSWMVVNSLREGLETVREGRYRDYAFIHDTPALLDNIDIMRQECQFTSLTFPRYGVGYGLGLPKGSPYLNDLNSAITALKTDGTLRTLKHKWWRVNECLEEDDDNNPSSRHMVSLSVYQLSGVFLLLAIGVLISLTLGVIEYFYRPRSKENHAKKTKRSENNSAKPSSAAFDVLQLETLPFTDTTTINEITTKASSSQSRETNF